MNQKYVTYGLYAVILLLAACILAPAAVCDIVDDTIPDGKLVNAGILIENYNGDQAYIQMLDAQETQTKCSTLVNFMRPVYAGGMIKQWPFYMGTERGKIISTIGPDQRVTTYDIDLFKIQLYSIPHCIEPGNYQLSVALTDENNNIIHTMSKGVYVQ